MIHRELPYLVLKGLIHLTILVYLTIYRLDEAPTLVLKGRDDRGYGYSKVVFWETRGSDWKWMM